MTHEQREEYIRRAKKAFHTNPNYRDRKEKDSYKQKSYSVNSYNSNSYQTLIYDDRESDSTRLFGFWKIRFVIALILFVAVFSLHQNKSDDVAISFEKITTLVEKNINTETVAAWFEQQSTIK